MDEFPIESETLHAIYLELAEEVLEREDVLEDVLPLSSSADIASDLSGVVERWSDARKSLRTYPTANVFSREIADSLDQSILKLLVGLDAQVNVLDDIIDTAALGTQRRVALTANAAFSSSLILEHAPPPHRQEIASVLREYFTSLFQIPLVEERLFETIRDTDEANTRRDAGVDIYTYRARDIDAFANILAIATDVGEQSKQRLLSDLRVYRARRLLYKDISDVPRDVADTDMTPIIALLESDASIERIETEIEQMYQQFGYTTTGHERYGDILETLESEPDDVTDLLRERRGLVRETVDSIEG